MVTKLISIGNSRGVRIPKHLLTESGLEEDVVIEAKKGEIRIIPAPLKNLPDTLILSEKSLASDWNKADEDKAWESLQ